MPHASGANAERIKSFVVDKLRAHLSNKVNPDILDTGLARRLKKLENLRAL